MPSPHRTAQLTADLSLEIDGVPYSARVTLTPGKLPKRTAALSVVQPVKVERANCVVCTWGSETIFDSCQTAQSPWNTGLTGICPMYSPSLWTRLLRKYRLGRPAAYLETPPDE